MANKKMSLYIVKHHGILQGDIMINRSKNHNYTFIVFGAVMTYIIAFLIALVMWVAGVFGQSLFSLIEVVVGVLTGMILLDLFLFRVWSEHTKNTRKFVMRVVFPLVIYVLCFFIYGSLYNSNTVWYMEDGPLKLSLAQTIIGDVFSSDGCFILVVVGTIVLVEVILKSYSDLQSHIG